MPPPDPRRIKELIFCVLHIPTGAILCMRPANERRRYKCNVVYLWLGVCREWPRTTILRRGSVLYCTVCGLKKGIPACKKPKFRTYHPNSLDPGRWSCDFKLFNIKDRYREPSMWNRPHVNAILHRWWLVNTESSYGMWPSGNKPLPEPMLTNISVGIWRHYATIS